MSEVERDSSTKPAASDEGGAKDLVDRLLDRWELNFKNGVELAPEVLCQDNPELYEEVREAIESLVAFARFDQEVESNCPTQVGNYRILWEIGRGASSVVYLAEQDWPRRRVALKLLRDVTASTRRQRQFLREADLLASLNNQHIAQIYESGIAEVYGARRLYFTMEYIDGTTVTDYVRQKSASEDWSVRRTVSLCLPFALAIEEVNASGVVHRDIKPGNMMVTSAGLPKLIDFGLALSTQTQPSPHRHSTALRIVGTRCYMSPEQFSGQSGMVDARSDVYSLAVVLYEMLVGQLPHDIEDRSFLETAEIVRTTPARPIGQVDSGMRGDLEIVLATALQIEPTERYQSVKAFADDLSRFVQGRPIQAKPANLGTVLWKWCKRHRRAAILSSTATILLFILAASSIVSSWRASKHGQRLEQASRHLETKRAEVATAGKRLDEVLERRRRTAFNQTLLSLGRVAGHGRRHVYEQLHNSLICPPQFRGFAWRVLEQSVRPATVLLKPSGEVVFDIKISDHGGRVVASSPSGVSVWDGPTQALIARTAGQVSPSVELAIDKQCNSVLFCRADGAVVRWNPDDDSTVVLPRSQSSRVTSLAVVPQTTHGLIGTESGELEYWSLADQRMQWSRRLASTPIIGLEISADPMRIGVATSDGDLIVCSSNDGVKLARQRVVHPYDPQVFWKRARFSSDLRFAAVAAQTSTVIVWDTDQETAVRVFDNIKPFPDVALLASHRTSHSPDFLLAGRQVVERWSDTHPRSLVYEAGDALTENTQIDNESQAKSDLEPYAIASTATGSKVAIALRNGGIAVATATPDPLFHQLPTARPTVAGLAFSKDGRRLACYSGGGVLSLHDIRSGDILWEHASEAKGRILDLDFDATNRFVLARKIGSGLAAWNAESGQHLGSAHVASTARKMLVAEARVLLGISGDQAAWLPIELTSGGELQFGKAPLGINESLMGIEFDRSSGIYALVGENQAVTTGRIGEDERFHVIASRVVEDISQIALAPGGEEVVCGLRDGTLLVLSTSTLEEIFRSTHGPHRVGGMDISRDGSVLATGYFDGEVVFWDTLTWEPQLSIRTSLTPIRDVEFSPDGQTLVVGGKGGHVAVFRSEPPP